jgi:hypothetical protein
LENKITAVFSELILRFKQGGFWQFMLLTLLFPPLFFINVRNSHDWGDDFAQYIHQAQNIVEGIPQTETGYIYNEDHPFLAPPSYPVGFPLLLAPVYAFANNEIKAFSFFMTFILFILSLLLFIFYKKFFSARIAVFAVLAFAYHPWMLYFKTNILSELPFTLFFMLSIILYLAEARREYLRHAIIGFLSAYLMLIKSLGAIFLLAVLLDSVKALYSEIKEKREYKTLISSRPILFAAAISTYWIFNNIIFKTTEPFNHFLPLFDLGTIKTRLLINSEFYLNVFQDYFHLDNGSWRFVPLAIKAMALTFLVLGFINKILEKIGILELLTMGYFAVLLVWPNTTQGFRYLLPVFPLLIYYVIHGIQSLKLSVNIKPNAIALCLGVLILWQYRLDVKTIIEGQNKILAGPQEAESLEAFNYIKSKVPENSVIAFIKPRALSLYAGRKSISCPPAQSLQELAASFNRHGVDYFLTHTELSDEALNNYLKENEKNIELVWQNQKFRLYKAKT